MTGTRLDGIKLAESVRFDLNAHLDEKERRSGKVTVLFGLSIKTKPNVVKYEIEGTAILTGKEQAIEQLLKNDPKLNIPFVFNRIYQQVFTSIFMLSSSLSAIYPPPDLFSVNYQGLPVKNANSGSTPEVAVDLNLETNVIKKE